jgi:hypothetical protein
VSVLDQSDGNHTNSDQTVTTYGGRLTPPHVRLRRAASTLVWIGYSVLALSIIGGLVLALNTAQPSDAFSNPTHPYVGVGLAVMVAGSVNGFLIRFAGLFGIAWAASRD